MGSWTAAPGLRRRSGSFQMGWTVTQPVYLPFAYQAMRSMVHKFIMLPVIKIGFAITCSPGALTRSRAKKIAMEEAEVHGRMALEHLMQF
ncbi:hypothetical protein PVAP13_5NG174100 [Panicum virgatum]|uniref:Uncharacterized protein n=1 Tax=Panicum virgatum TaxID=38727 RepID=A0A8T0RSK4_PANVG|nr:hypothetical protein PVAP13_5NG174100 [Panicum virgatum]